MFRQFARQKPKAGFSLIELLVVDPGMPAGVAPQYWPQGAAGDKTTGPIVYFRSEGGGYTGKHYRGRVYPAVDARLGTPGNYPWLCPRGTQLWSSGRDFTYAKQPARRSTPPAPTTNRPPTTTVTVHGPGGRGTGPCFRPTCEPPNGSTRRKTDQSPSRPVNGYLAT